MLVCKSYFNVYWYILINWFFFFKLEINQALKIVVQQSGIKGLWMGLSSTLFRDVPFSALYWLNYETIKKLFPDSRQSFLLTFFAGATAGSVSFFLLLLLKYLYFK